MHEVNSKLWNMAWAPVPKDVSWRGCIYLEKGTSSNFIQDKVFGWPKMLEGQWWPCTGMGRKGSKNSHSHLRPQMFTASILLSFGMKHCIWVLFLFLFHGIFTHFLSWLYGRVKWLFQEFNRKFKLWCLSTGIHAGLH